MSTHFYNTATDDETQITVSENLVPAGDRSLNIRTGNSVVSYQSGEATQVDTYSSFNTADLNTSGPLDVRTPWGSPRQGALQPTDVVRLPTGETTVQVAESLGLIEKDVHGRYVLVPDGASCALANEPTQEAPVDEGEAFSSPDVEANLGDLCSITSGTTQVAVLQQLISNGEVLPGTLARAASEGGIEPSALNDRISAVVEGFQSQAETVLKGMGADDASLFWEWAQANHKDDLKKAMTAHAMERTTKGYQPLYQTYVETLDAHSPEDILSAQFGDDIKAQKIDGKVILDIPGYGRMTYRSAIKAGLIRVSGV
jgi:hypothetical protein